MSDINVKGEFMNEYIIKFSDVVLKTKPLYYNSANIDFLKTIFDYLQESLNSLSIVICKKNTPLLFIRMLSIDVKKLEIVFEKRKFYVILKLDISKEICSSDLKSLDMSESELREGIRLNQFEAKLRFTAKSLSSAKSIFIRF